MIIVGSRIVLVNGVIRLIIRLISFGLVVVIVCCVVVVFLVVN